MIRKSRMLLVLIATAAAFGALAAPAFADHTILTGPADGSTVTSNAITFTWAGSSTSTYLCMVNDGAWFTCASPYSYSAPRGQNSFKLKSSAGHSHPGAEMIKRTFTVSDTTGPAAPTITSGPSGTVASTSATFAWTGAEPGGTFQCSFDGAAYAGCTSPRGYTGLAQGAHTFSVRQIDSLGNVGTAASRSFAVDTTVPVVPTPASVSSVSAGCAGDTITADAEATGSSGQTFSLALHADGSATGQSQTVTLDGSGSYQATFDVSALDASVYKVVSSTGADSGDVAAATCAPGAEIPEAPLALLLPLSTLGTLALAGLWLRRRPRTDQALV